MPISQFFFYTFYLKNHPQNDFRIHLKHIDNFGESDVSFLIFFFKQAFRVVSDSCTTVAVELTLAIVKKSHRCARHLLTISVTQLSTFLVVSRSSEDLFADVGVFLERKNPTSFCSMSELLKKPKYLKQKEGIFRNHSVCVN